MSNIFVEIKGFYIYDEALGVGRRDGAVKETCGCGDCSGWGREGAVVI